MKQYRLQTPQLQLISATAESLKADLEGRESLEKVLKMQVPEQWPPELYDRTAMQYSYRQLQDPEEAGWSLWYLANRGDSQPVLVGIAGFKGQPNFKGSVEVGYSVLQEFQRRGFATEAVRALVRWAFEHSEVRRVLAETYPRLPASIRVLEKNGFTFIGQGSEADIIRYELRRSNGAEGG